MFKKFGLKYDEWGSAKKPTVLTRLGFLRPFLFINYVI